MVQTFGARQAPQPDVVQLLNKWAVPYTGKREDLDVLVDIVGDAEFALIGEASHGTREFYQTRAELTRRLIEEKGFNAVCAEADWPDAWRVNRYVKGAGIDVTPYEALAGFQRFPTWMWRNTVVVEFIEWLRRYNAEHHPDYAHKIGFYGLDLYSLYSSTFAVINYLERVDPAAARRAKDRYACLEMFGADEQAYGYAASLGLTKECQNAVVAELLELRREEATYMLQDGRSAEDEYFFVEQNARLVKNAEEYYREMFKGRVDTWNLRDTHMVETLHNLRDYYARNGQTLKAVVWEHNSHLGDARATQMGQQGEINVGQLAREHWGQKVRLLGFSGYAGTVTAASSWGGRAERKNVRPGLPGSYEELFHKIDIPAFTIPVKNPELVEPLAETRLQRAIGVIYMPETERWSHYFYSRLPYQFDAIMHFQQTQAVEPLERTPEWVSGEMRVEENID